MATVGQSSRNGELFGRLDGDLWLCHKLFRAGVPVGFLPSVGTTTPAERREAARRLIVERRLGATLVPGDRDRPPETFSGAFTRIYGGAL